MKRKYWGVCPPSNKPDIFKEFSGIPADVQRLKESQAAIGTPIKLTKSFPAKAIAKANVPAKTIILKIFTLAKYNNWDKIPKKIIKLKMIIPECESIQSKRSLLTKETLLSPLMTRKYISAVRATPPKIPLK